MPEFLMSVDKWFLVLVVVLMVLYVPWSLKKILEGLQRAITEFKDEIKAAIKELYNHRNDHENRITAIETKCDMYHRRVNDK